MLLFGKEEIAALEKGFYEMSKNLVLNFLPDFANIYKNHD